MTSNRMREQIKRADLAQAQICSRMSSLALTLSTKAQAYIANLNLNLNVFIEGMLNEVLYSMGKFYVRFALSEAFGDI